MPAIAIPEPYQHHVGEAWNQLAAGKKPSADSVLEVVRGSKATAVSAMQFFWTAYLPDMLAGRGAEVPDPIARLAAGLWQTALKLSDERASRALAGERDALAQATRMIEAEREGLAAERLRARAALGDAQARAARDLEAAIAKERKAHDMALQAERRRHDDKEARAARAIESLEKAAGKLREQVDELKDELRSTERLQTATKLSLAATTAELEQAKRELIAATALADTRLGEVAEARAAADSRAAEHRSERETQAQQHEATVAKLQAEHAVEVGRLSGLLEEALSQLRLANDAHVTELRKSRAQSRAPRSRTKAGNTAE